MSKVNVLPVSSREGVGKGAARAARREGFVPAVVYGAGEPPLALNIKQNELIKALKRGKFLSSLLDLDVDGGAKKIHVIPKEVQRDVVLDLPTHVDFLRLSDRSMINIFVPVEFENHDAAPGLKKGGVLTIIAHDVQVRCRAGNIPEKLVCDLTGKAIGDTLTADTLPLPSGVVLTGQDHHYPIASIAAPSGLSGGDDEGEGGEGEAEAAEG